MRKVGISQARKQLSSLVDEAARRHRRVLITRRGLPAVVIMSSDEFEGWQETIEIMSDTKAMAAIRQGLRDIAAGRVTPREEIRARLTR